MQNQNLCIEYGYQNEITSLAQDIGNKASFHDALLTPKEEQIEDAATLRTAPSELSSEGGETFQCINNSDDESKTFDQLNRNENDYGHGGDTGIRDIIWSKDEHNTDNECNMGNNTLSEECGKFIVDNIPSFIIPTPLTDINDSRNSSSDSVSELGSDMSMNNSRRHIFSNFWQRKDTNSDSLSEHSSNCNNHSSSSSYAPHYDLSEILFPYSTTKICVQKIKSERFRTTVDQLKEEENPSRIHDSEDDKLRTTEKISTNVQDRVPLSSENQPNAIQSSILKHTRRKVLPDNFYKSTGEYIPKVSSTSVLLHSRRANTKSQESCLRRTASALEPRSMKRCEGGGKVTFDSKVSIVEYDQRLSLSTSAGWSKLFM